MYGLAGRYNTLEWGERIEIDEREFNPNFLRDVAPQAGVAVGLALRRLGDR